MIEGTADAASLRAATETQKIAIFWGGGLGDALAIRPLLVALEKAGTHPPTLFTTATHLPRVFDALHLPIRLQQLDADPIQAIQQVRRAGKFDIAYLGPHPTWRTRLLARTAPARRIWSRPGSVPNQFIEEVVRRDACTLGRLDTDLAPYGGTPIFRTDGAPAASPADKLLVLHMGAKAAWQTTRWPHASWSALVRELLRQTDAALCCVGMPHEAEFVDSIVGGHRTARLKVCTDLDLGGLERLLESADGVVCHNSGVMHLAAALRKRTVVLTGSSAPFWRPPFSWVSNISSGACELACNRYSCPVPFYRGKCIGNLTVERVVAEVSRFIYRR